MDRDQATDTKLVVEGVIHVTPMTKPTRKDEAKKVPEGPVSILGNEDRFR